MTIAEVDKEVKNVIEKNSVYGLESILCAVVRSTKDNPYMDKEYCLELFKKCYERLEQWGE